MDTGFVEHMLSSTRMHPPRTGTIKEDESFFDMESSVLKEQEYECEDGDNQERRGAHNED